MPKARQQEPLRINREEIIEFPLEETEVRRPIRKADWNRLKRNISNIPSEVSILQIVYSILFGFGGSSALSTLHINPDEQPWLFSIYLCLSIFSIGVAAIFVAVHRGLKKSKVGYIENVVKKDIEDIESAFAIEEAEREREEELKIYTVKPPSSDAEWEDEKPSSDAEWEDEEPF